MQDSHALAGLDLWPTSLFEGFPYLVTRVVPAMYHVIVLPDDLEEADLIETTLPNVLRNTEPRGQARGAAAAHRTGHAQDWVYVRRSHRDPQQGCPHLMRDEVVGGISNPCLLSMMTDGL